MEKNEIKKTRPKLSLIGIASRVREFSTVKTERMTQMFHWFRRSNLLQDGHQLTQNCLH